MRSRALLAALAALLVVAAGCSDGGSDDPTAAPATAPATYPGPEPPAPFNATDAAPKGWLVTQCADLRARNNSHLASRFGVPPTFAWLYRDGETCDFGAGFAREIYVTVDPNKTLLEVKEQDVDPYTAPGQGDGQLGEVSYAADVPVFGDTVGERLDYYCFCDGQDLDYRLLQAHGVRFTWVSPHGRSRHDGDLTATTDSLGLVRSDRSICSARGKERTASYVPPIPQTESIDNYGDGCHLYLQPGRNSLQRYAEVVPAPPRTVDQVASDLDRDRHVHGIVVERGTARLDGQRADHVVWRYTQRGQTWRGVTLATPDLQVTWSSKPRMWRQEADVYRSFVGSVHLLPRRR